MHILVALLQACLLTWRMPPSIDCSQVEFKICDGVALITLCGDDSISPWGTAAAEHRWNPLLVKQLNSVFDKLETNIECCCIVLHNAGKYWSNGMDLNYMDGASQSECAAHERATNVLMARGQNLPTLATSA